VIALIFLSIIREDPDPFALDGTAAMIAAQKNHGKELYNAIRDELDGAEPVFRKFFPMIRSMLHRIPTERPAIDDVVVWLQNRVSKFQDDEYSDTTPLLQSIRKRTVAKDWPDVKQGIQGAEPDYAFETDIDRTQSSTNVAKRTLPVEQTSMFSPLTIPNF
jgi:hypothetical protein